MTFSLSKLIPRALLRLLCAFALIAAAPLAQAQSCTASATAMAFGVYNPQLALPNDTVATVTVTCSAVISLLVGYNISISTGGSNSYASRSLTTGSANMNYQIYTDLQKTKVWGDGTGGTQIVSDGYLLQVVAPVVKPYIAYGRIPALQNAKTGSYTDSTMVTISY